MDHKEMRGGGTGFRGEITFPYKSRISGEVVTRSSGNQHKEK